MKQERFYTKFYNILKENYKFSPKIISCDFGLGNLKGFKNIHSDSGTKIITCFFHLTQAWWKKANSLGLRKKIYIKDTRVLIFNLQRLAFLNYDNVIKLYKKIKSRKEYKDIENYLDFFDYFEKNWFPVIDKKNKIIQSSTYEFNLWNYYNKLEYGGAQSELLLKDEMEKYIVFYNNCCESINSLIKNLIPLHLKVSVNLFKNILIMLFNRSECKRKRNNFEQGMRLIIKRSVSDQMLELSNDYGSNFIEYETFIKIKHMINENIIYNLPDDGENNELNNVSKNNSNNIDE